MADGEWRMASDIALSGAPEGSIVEALEWRMADDE